MLKMKKRLLVFIICGIVYLSIEVIFTALSGNLSREYNITYWAFKGFSSLYMFFVGGFLGVLLDQLNEIKCIEHWKMVFQALIGVFIIEIGEFLSGLILNVWLGLNIWDYSSSPFNLLGQIELFHAIGFFFLSPLAFWLGDHLRFVYYGEGKKYGPIRNYKFLFTWK